MLKEDFLFEQLAAKANLFRKKPKIEDVPKY